MAWHELSTGDIIDITYRENGAKNQHPEHP